MKSEDRIRIQHMLDFDVDLTIVYQIIVQDLPSLIKQLESLLKR